MLKVCVSGELVCGSDRGGEDLFLVFEASADLARNALPWLMSAEIELSEDFKELKGSTPPGVSPQFKLEMGEYGFFWKGTKEVLRDLVWSELSKNENWSRPGVVGTRCVFVWRYLVAGNAD